MGGVFSNQTQSGLVNKIQKTIAAIKEKISENNAALAKINNQNILIEQRLSSLTNITQTEIKELKENIVVNDSRIIELIQYSQSLETKFSELESTFISVNDKEKSEREKSDLELYKKIEGMKIKTDKKINEIGEELNKLINGLIKMEEIIEEKINVDELKNYSENLERKIDEKISKIETQVDKIKNVVSTQYKEVIENIFKVNNDDLEDSLQNVLEDEGNNAWLPDDIERKLIRNSVVVVYDLLKKSRN